MGLPKGPAPKLAEPERREKYLAALASGQSLAAAARAAGISARNVRQYMKRCQSPDATGDEHLFLRCVEEAEEQAEGELARVIVDAAITVNSKTGTKDWRAAAWLLERRWPDRWAQKREAEAPTVGLIEMLRSLDQATITGERVAIQLSKGEAPAALLVTPPGDLFKGPSLFADRVQERPLPPPRREERVYFTPEEAKRAQREESDEEG